VKLLAMEPQLSIPSPITLLTRLSPIYCYKNYKFTCLFRTPYTGRDFLCCSNVPRPGCLTSAGLSSSLGFFELLLKFTIVVGFFVGNLGNNFPPAKLCMVSIFYLQITFHATYKKYNLNITIISLVPYRMVSACILIYRPK
jgi:hypothetical protein